MKNLICLIYLMTSTLCFSQMSTGGDVIIIAPKSGVCEGNVKLVPIEKNGEMYRLELFLDPAFFSNRTCILVIYNERMSNLSKIDDIGVYAGKNDNKNAVLVVPLSFDEDWHSAMLLHYSNAKRAYIFISEDYTLFDGYVCSFVIDVPAFLDKARMDSGLEPEKGSPIIGRKGHSFDIGVEEEPTTNPPPRGAEASERVRRTGQSTSFSQ